MAFWFIGYKFPRKKDHTHTKHKLWRKNQREERMRKTKIGGRHTTHFGHIYRMWTKSHTFIIIFAHQMQPPATAHSYFWCTVTIYYYCGLWLYFILISYHIVFFVFVRQCVFLVFLFRGLHLLLYSVDNRVKLNFRAYAYGWIVRTHTGFLFPLASPPRTVPYISVSTFYDIISTTRHLRKENR